MTLLGTVAITMRPTGEREDGYDYDSHGILFAVRCHGMVEDQAGSRHPYFVSVGESWVGLFGVVL